MIDRFRDAWLEKFFVHDRSNKNIPAELENRLFRKLQLIDDATRQLDLRSPPSNHFERLKGNLAGKHSIRVNRQWRLIFEWDNQTGKANDL